MQNREAAESKFSKVVTGVLVGVVVAVVSLILEHKTSFFARTFSNEPSAPHEASDANSPPQNQGNATTTEARYSDNAKVDESSDSQGDGKELSVNSEEVEIGSQARPLTAEDTSVSSAQESEPKQKPFVKQQTANDFNFILEECGPDGNDLRCRVLVSSVLGDKRIMISDHSRLKVGTRSIEPSKLIKDTGKDYSTAIHFNVPAGEQIEFIMVFSGLRDVREASLLEVKCAGFSVSWNNPPIG